MANTTVGKSEGISFTAGGTMLSVQFTDKHYGGSSVRRKIKDTPL